MPSGNAAWRVDSTDEFDTWVGQLTKEEQDRIIAAVDSIEEGGPTLGRPLVDTIVGSRHPNMKELRPRPGNLRIFFAFDPRRHAILLLGGDKTGQWQKFYDRMIPKADALFDTHLENLRRGGSSR